MNKVFNRNLLRIHRDFASINIIEHDFLIKHSAEQVFDHTSSLNRKYEKILDLGARHGLLTDRLIKYYNDSYILASDISPEMLNLNDSINKSLFDEEYINLGERFNLITSVLNLHWINNFPNFLHKIKSHLTDDGLFIFSMFCGPSLKNLRYTIIRYESECGSASSPHISPFVDPKDLYRLLQNASFKFIVLDIDNIELEYDSPIAFMKELKGMGESNNLFSSSNRMSKNVVQKFMQSHNKFTDIIQIATVVAK